MKKKLYKTLFAALTISATLASCNDNDESTGNDGDTPAMNNTQDMRNDKNVNSGDKNDENNLINEPSSGGDNGADVTPNRTDSTRTNSPHQ
ncbi:MAG TPA: hypothetical protein VGC65_08670 [Bacteroidia bacterium]|jgi:hypothetical protein